MISEFLQKQLGLVTKNQPSIQEISNGRTHGPRTPNKPEYLIRSIATYLEVRW